MPKKLTLLILISSLALVLASCAPAADPPEEPAAGAVEEASAEEVVPTNTPLPPTEEPEEEEEAEEPAMVNLIITSPAFAHEEAIPIQFSCDGEDISPELAWTGVPEGAASLVLIVDDPDAPVGVWDHWVLFNIAPDTAGLAQGGTVGTDGGNSWGSTGYGGPCPPGGTHRYFFKLYALDTTLDLPEGSTKGVIETAMEGHILGYAELMGTYTR